MAYQVCPLCKDSQAAADRFILPQVKHGILIILHVGPPSFGTILDARAAGDPVLHTTESHQRSSIARRAGAASPVGTLGTRLFLVLVQYDLTATRMRCPCSRMMWRRLAAVEHRNLRKVVIADPAIYNVTFQSLPFARRQEFSSDCCRNEKRGATVGPSSGSAKYPTTCANKNSFPTFPTQ